MRQSLAAAPLPGADFDGVLNKHALGALRREAPAKLQVNVGKLCNQACHHCHVDAGPKRTEQMDRRTAERVLELLAASPTVRTLDITGGAPELNAQFQLLVTGARAHGRDVIDRCNLTVLLEPGQEGTAEFLVAHHVHVIASLPCYTQGNVDGQRGAGAFERSIEALRLLNRLGYARPDSGLMLDLAYNPLGAFLPPAQESLEARYRQELEGRYEIRFNALLTIANMPIQRFARDLVRQGKHGEYMSLLVNHFNPETVPGLMCRTMVSVDFQGALYDCDFNQMLKIPLGRRARTVWNVANLAALGGERIATAAHCFGCTAGTGSSCGGALVAAPR